jgi:hypothetical protein
VTGRANGSKSRKVEGSGANKRDKKASQDKERQGLEVSPIGKQKAERSEGYLLKAFEV